MGYPFFLGSGDVLYCRDINDENAGYEILNDSLKCKLFMLKDWLKMQETEIAELENKIENISELIRKEEANVFEKQRK